MVSSILWYQSARRAAFTFRFHQRLGRRANPLVQHIAVLLFVNLVKTACDARLRESTLARQWDLLSGAHFDVSVIVLSAIGRTEKELQR
jgi:hypothetical protein